MKELLEKLKIQALEEIAKAASTEALYLVQVKYLGRKGEITNIMKGLGDLPPAEKPAAGKMCNVIKQALEQAFEAKKTELTATEISQKLSDTWVDVTAPGKEYKTGHIHPISQVQYEVEQIFSDMGFAIMDGPEIESEYYNFEGLNIPPHHPARDMQDTFFIKESADCHCEPQRSNLAKSDTKAKELCHGEHVEPCEVAKSTLRQAQGDRLVLRTHTSPVQVRTMEKYGAPLRIIVPGRVFRNEATDARHEHTFNQVEGLLIDKDISLAHLKGVMQEFLTRLFGREVKVRFRPGYFPFVEPGIELDMSCMLCNETGCRVCKHTGWLEFMGAGMVHPNVLKAGGIDSKIYQGWAFGFGLTRLVMMRYGIDDIRHLSSGDLRFLEQF